MWLIIVFLAAAISFVSTDDGEEAPLVAVYALRDKLTRLPCNVTAPPNDAVVLVLWYKDGTKTPVYSVDSRNKPLSEGKRWTSKEVFGARATFEVSEGLSHLVVNEAKFPDEGLYWCRVDFKLTPTHIGRVNLHVVDPPRALRLFTIDGVAVEENISAKEGQPLGLNCRASGGDPAPTLQWWSNGKEVKRKNEPDIGSNQRQTVTVTSLGIYELIYPEKELSHKVLQHENISCTASNNPEIEPLVASVRLISTEEAPLSVDMTVPPNPLVGGKEYQVTCRAEGVQPPPVISWLLGGTKLKEYIESHQVSETATSSVLRLKVGYADDLSRLECQALAPSLPNIKDSHAVTLHVNYVPEAKILLTNPTKFPTNLRKEINNDVTNSGFSEGQSAVFNCETKANPATYNVTFLFNGRPLHLKYRAFNKNSTLTLNNITHSDAGLYTCVASNSIGDGQSNAVGLHINYAPVCKRTKSKEILALPGETVQLMCDVLASPRNVKFDWRVMPEETLLQQLGDSPVDHSDDETMSRGAFVMTNSSERITVKCWSSNKVGPTKHPCEFDITLVDLPGPLIGCKQESVTSYSADIACSPGSTGGLS